MLLGGKMIACPKCGNYSSTQMCLLCGADVYAKTTDTFPRVTWSEVHDHFMSRLSIDEQWTVEEDSSLTWWPWFLQQRISVESQGAFEGDSGDNWMRIQLDIPIASAPEHLALGLVAEANSIFPLGSFTYTQGTLRVGSTLALNPLCRNLLSLLHEQALAQVVVAHELALEWDRLDGVEVLTSAHPASGPRSEPDELMGIYSGDTYSLPVIMNFPEILEQARPFVRQVMNRYGWQDGYAAHDVDFYNGPGFDLAIGRLEDTDIELKYGPGLFIMVRVLPPGMRFSLEEANFANQDMAALPLTSNLGPVVTGPVAEPFGSHVRAFLPHGYLAEYRLAPDKLAVAITNAVTHMAAATQVFRTQVLQIDDA